MVSKRIVGFQIQELNRGSYLLATPLLPEDFSGGTKNYHKC
jgi:hypothetical protein